MKSKAEIKKDQAIRAKEIADFVCKFDLFKQIKISILNADQSETYQGAEADRETFFKALERYRLISELLE